MKTLKTNGLLIIIIIYLLISLSLKLHNFLIYQNIVNPLFWFFVLIYLMLKSKNSYFKLFQNKNCFLKAIILALFSIIIYFQLGFIFHFSKSPFNHSPFGIFKNFLILIIPNLGLESLRFYLLTIKHQNHFFLTIILIILELNFYFLNLTPFSLFKYLSAYLIPNIAKNILYTYLTLYTKQGFSLIFSLVSNLLIILLPIIPSLDWFMICSSSLILTIFIYLFFKTKIIKPKVVLKLHRLILKKISYSLTLFLLIIYVAFILGKLKYKPIAILSNSMIPNFNRGDIVIFQKINPEKKDELKKNTIIIYQINNQYIAHRIVKVIEDKETTFYITKGDNNKAIDSLKVNKNQILGTYVTTIKYIGYPSVWLHDYFNQERNNGK